MKILLYPHQWKILRLDDPDRLTVARAAFYLGFGFEGVDKHVNETNAAFVSDLIYTAKALGMTDDDTVQPIGVGNAENT